MKRYVGVFSVYNGTAKYRVLKTFETQEIGNIETIEEEAQKHFKLYESIYDETDSWKLLFVEEVVSLEQLWLTLKC